MKERGALLLIVIVLILLPSMSASIAKTEELQKSLKSISYYAENYEGKNIGYAEATTKINAVVSKIDSLLGSGTIDEKGLIAVLGKPKEANWVSKGGNKIEAQEPEKSWKTTLYDGEDLSIRANINPILTSVNGKDTIVHSFDLNIVFPDSKTDLNVEKAKEEILVIQNLAKEFNLNPENLEVKNQLAQGTSNLQFLFKDSMEKNSESCEGFFTKVLGEESKVSNLQIMKKEFTLNDDGNIKTMAKMEYCEVCTGPGITNWLTLEFEFIGENGKVDYLLFTEIDKSLYAGYGENEFKKNFIDSVNAFLDLTKDGNYRAAFNVGIKMKAMNQAWDTQANKDSSQSPQNFLNRLNFLTSLFKEFPSTEELTKQIEFRKNLVKEFKEEAEEICNNEVDDNENGKIDCEESICNGEICGIRENENETIYFYCIEGGCKEKAQVIEPKNTTCGNGVCEEGEIELCTSDCTECPKRLSLICDGKVIFKGKDSKGCDLEPICVKESNSCETNADCQKPLCGLVQCIEGKCRTTDLTDCTQEKCFDGEKRVESCIEGDEIIKEICKDKIWIKTGQACSAPSRTPVKTLEEKGQICEKKEDCPDNQVCSSGLCKTIAKNAREEKGTTSISKYTARTFTGQVVSITGEYMTGEWITGQPFTGVVGDPNPETNPYAYEEPKDYERPTKQVSGNSPFTIALSPVESEEATLREIPEQVSETSQTIELPNELQEIYTVRGFCTEIKGQEESTLVFSGAGEDFNKVNALQNQYNNKNGAYCDWKLKQALETRENIEKSLNQKYIEEFFERDVASNANDWETKKQELINLFDDAIANQIEILMMMDCLNIKELSNYNLINIDYENSYGIFKYSEEGEGIKLNGMKSKVQGITPKMEVSVFPNKFFIEGDLIKAMAGNEFIGSTSSIMERNARNGLTKDEIETLNNNPELIEKIQTLTNQYNGKLAFSFTIVDSKKEPIYNLYGELSNNENNLIKIQPMTIEMTPKKNIEIIAPFENLHNIIAEAEEDGMKLTAPWDPDTSPISILKKAINGMEMWLKFKSMIRSIEFYPDNNKAKEVFEEVFILIAENQETQKKVDTPTKVYNLDGKSFSI